ncbi:MAG: hypothetical protein M1826_001711 [Phylliscum demangeonii]|nr:MAG: hypothetical protein M1826_001711 [Phylliscum demangeonii]
MSPVLVRSTGSAPAVHAHSLSSLTTLAANPPPYPRPPPPPPPAPSSSSSSSAPARSRLRTRSTEQAPAQAPERDHERERQPLQLYLARVPGSQDVFLTPLKPRQKVVTAEDVATSLYYLHLEQRHERAQHEMAHGRPPSSPNHPLPQLPPAIISRKPLPPKPGLPPATEERAGDEAWAGSSNNAKATRRKPIHDRLHSVPVSVPVAPTDEEGTRRPLGARAARVGHAAHPVVDRAWDGDGDGDGDGPPPPLPARPPPPPPPPPPGSHSAMHGAGRSSAQERWSAGGRVPADDPDVRRPTTSSSGPGAAEPSFAITLIRRDPASGVQWNVGRIIGVVDSSSSSRQRYTVSIEISNPGYGKFVRATPAGAADDGVFRRTITGAIAGSSGGGGGGGGGDSGGRRHRPRRGLGLGLGRGRGRGRGSGRRRRPPGLPGPPCTPQQQLRLSHQRAGVDSLLPSSTTNRTLPPPPTPPPPTPDTTTMRHAPATSPAADPQPPQPQQPDYTFSSPWPGGVCQFFTGPSGRSLKCKHLLRPLAASSSSSSSVSPLPFAPSSHGTRPSPATPTTATPPTRSVPLSELRISLPVPGAARPRRRFSSPSPSPSSWLSSSPRPFASSSHPRRRLAALGRERAGGGRDGTRAKLGKLLVQPPGLEMLDLLVAANLGVWWHAYW